MFTDRKEHWLNVIFRDKVLLPGTEGVIVPSGFTGQRPSPADPGTIRYNTTTNRLEAFVNGLWEDIATSGTFTVSNVGTGVGIYKTQVGTDFRFKSLLAGTNINISDAGDELIISAAGGSSGEANTGSNLGTGSPVFASKVGTDLRFRSLKSLSPSTLSISNTATEVQLTLSGAPYLSLTGGTLSGDLIFSSGGIKNRSGTEIAPSYTFQADTNTGIRLVNDNRMAFITDGNDRLEIEPDGTLSVPASANYETLVTDDDDIPNKKYVDDAIGGGTNIYRQSFTDANLIAGVVQIAHNLGDNHVQVTIYDNTNKIIVPDEVVSISTNISEIDLNSFGVLVGTWYVVVVG